LAGLPGLSGLNAGASLDWILLAVLLISCLIGMWRGLVYEALVLAGWVVAFFVARWGGEAAGLRLPLGDASAQLRTGLGGTLVFIAVAFVWGWLAWRIRRAVRIMGLRPVDGVLGAIFGAARALAVLLAAVALANLTPLAHEPWWNASVGVHWLEMTLQQLRSYLPPEAVRYLPA
jgi:membrane protein required for colicin V production